MQEQPVIQINNNEEFNGKVALPYNQEQFQSFIIGLLGKPQTIEKNFRGSFEIDMDFLGNLIQIVEQRIHQQNEAILLELRSTIIYDDGTSVSLSGYEHLINYNEPLPLVCKALHLTLQYLIKFKDKEVAEKQEISISFRTTGASEFEPNSLRFYSSHINIRIAHTARTFGADIEGLLTKHLSPLIKKDVALNKIHNLDDATVQSLFRFLVFTTAIAASYYWLNYNKVYLLIYLFAGLYAFCCLVDTVISSVMPDERPSFILITKESYRQKINDLKRFKKEWIRFVASTVGGLILSLIGSYLYSYLTK